MMDDFKRTYLCLCKEACVEPQECILNQLRDGCDGNLRKRLDLSTQSLPVDTCAILGKVLMNDIVFTELTLCDCMLNEEGAKLLLYGLCANTTIQMLDMKGNNLRAAGAETLGKLLRHNKSLKSLILEWNALGMWEEGFCVFCEGLRANKSLEHLDLRNNQINHQGVGELALALKHNNTLEELDLRWNNIGLLGGRALLCALQQNKILVRLELAGNNIPSDVLKAVEQAVDHNSECQVAMRESRTRSKVLTNEIQCLKVEKNKQFLNMMGVIDQQKEELVRSGRTVAVQVGQLQEALTEKSSIINSLRAKVQMTEAALTLSEQKSNDLKEFLEKTRMEKFELKEMLCKELKNDQEEACNREAKLTRELNTANGKNMELKNKVDELDRRCNVQHDQICQLKQELANVTAEMKQRILQTEERLEVEKKRCKQLLDDEETLRQKEMDQMNAHQQETERSFHDRILKLENIRIQLETELSRLKAAAVTNRAQAEEELIKVKNQIRLEEQERLLHLEEKLHVVSQTRDESQNRCTSQKQTINEIQAKNNKFTFEIEGLKRRIEELNEELSGKDQQKVAEVNNVRVELQEQIGHLQTERIAQEGLKEKISALERQLKVQSCNHRDAILDKENEISSLLEKVRMKDSEIIRMKEDEAQRASFLHNAILSYVQSSPLGAQCTKK
ncbi:leucine-rich repeat-containing protein 45 isoform X1 [Scyliorhinus canicula]|uniref:leucine-rich repeat-containing protein 45 isoform X1 n=1 Tax=Scyliorhinus canicula TaxID=7830 RepID=UPI0018F341AA|nr:leucine-rich repeat-containing protein 45 isoform X1 [Scyliorhinus canicula]XP_038633086.1 leucine-rich repeat-containing protein 45 isoform X1 [Scyliorhinus canicula]